jgi:citrate lyase subunit beta/citryl-CoA lyase
VPAAGLDADAAALMRSFLFVPADGGKKLHKALGCGADAVIVDLEDSIAPDRKVQARASAAAFVKEAASQAARPFICVRVNGLATGLIDADLEAIVPARPDAIMLPKAEGGSAVVHADAKLGAHEAINGLPDGHIKIVAMAIESAAGFFLAGTFRRQSARLIGLSWGAEDLAAELGAETNRDREGSYTSPYRLARTLCLMAAASAEIPAIETIYMDYRNTEGLRLDTEDARRDGFAGRLAIHPLQVPIINAVFTPRADEVAWAERIVAAFEAAGGAPTRLPDGEFIDLPVAKRARQILARLDPNSSKRLS